MSWIRKTEKTIEQTLKTAVVIMFISMFLAGVLQIVNRYFFGLSLSWSEELQRYLHIAIVFLSIPVAYRAGRHIHVDYIKNRMPPLMTRFLDFLIEGLWLMFACVVCYFTLQLMSVAKYQITPGLGLRMDFIYLPMCIGSVFLIVLVVFRLMTMISGQPVSKGDL